MSKLLSVDQPSTLCLQQQQQQQWMPAGAARAGQGETAAYAQHGLFYGPQGFRPSVERGQVPGTSGQDLASGLPAAVGISPADRPYMAHEGRGSRERDTQRAKASLGCSNGQVATGVSLHDVRSVGVTTSANPRAYGGAVGGGSGAAAAVAGATAAVGAPISSEERGEHFEVCTAAHKVDDNVF